MKIFSYIRFIIAMGLFGLVCSLVYEISVLSAENQIRKYDDANLNHMKYGLFNVNAWKEKMSGIVVSEIEEFKIEKGQKNDLRKHVEGQLSVLIEKLESQIKESNKGSTKGWIKQKLIDAFVDVKDIKEKIPDYADTIVQEMTQEESQKKLRDVVKGRVSKYLEETFEPYDTSEVQSIIKRTGKPNQEAAAEYLMSIVPTENKKLFELTWMLVAVSIVLFMLSLFHKDKLPAPYFFLCMATLVLLLYAGVTRPMIDMVARISNFSFLLFGHPVEFKNQIVYFQSKSILDVFWILIENKDVQMKIVGVLMILFSIVFPIFKLFACLMYYYNIFRARERGWVSYMVFKLGKWSMTDVQIVAIMMAYIGFNGMVKTQFDIIRAAIPQFNLISNNDTTLQIGFYIFLAYVILAMFFSIVIEKKMPSPKKERY